MGARKWFFVQFLCHSYQILLQTVVARVQFTGEFFSLYWSRFLIVFVGGFSTFVVFAIRKPLSPNVQIPIIRVTKSEELKLKLRCLFFSAKPCYNLKLIVCHLHHMLASGYWFHTYSASLKIKLFLMIQSLFFQYCTRIVI